jgi:hypothetical protein
MSAVETWARESIAKENNLVLGLLGEQRASAAGIERLKALLLLTGEIAGTLLVFDSYFDPESPGALFCSRCSVYSICGQPVEHLPSCLVGRVLELVSGLVKSFPEGTFAADPTLAGLKETAKRNGRHIEYDPEYLAATDGI